MLSCNMYSSRKCNLSSARLKAWGVTVTCLHITFERPSFRFAYQESTEHLDRLNVHRIILALPTLYSWNSVGREFMLLLKLADESQNYRSLIMVGPSSPCSTTRSNNHIVQVTIAALQRPR